jgi:gamma-glutamyl:cysteine ligase YbdK (ATP-grasp superfamily)
MAGKKRLGLFEVYGVELEYMIVDKKTLKIKPIADLLLKEVNGDFISDYDNGAIAWSNELVSHVIELKTNGPAASLKGMPALFSGNIRKMNKILDKFDAVLLPGAVHPFMDPNMETLLWQHEYSEIYEIYDRVYGCKGHGWSNLQSIHLNLPFRNDSEFGKLHAAIRMVLPLIPAITASSPVIDGKYTGWMDYRMQAYIHNQDKLPSMTGDLIPERAFSRKEYYDKIFNRIIKDFKPYDKDNISDHHYLNSRGAIARFDRGAIEIRVMDIQECPAADIAIIDIVTELIKMLACENKKIRQLKEWDEKELKKIFLATIKTAENTVIANSEYLSAFGIEAERMKASDVWEMLLNQIKSNMNRESVKIIKYILRNGTLSTRIMKGLSGNYSRKNIVRVYNRMAECLTGNILF